jgi:YteA family regulatory protein
MDRKKLDELKQKLEQQKKYAQDTLELVEKNEYNASLAEYTDELSMYDNHPADLGSETFEMEKSYILKAHQLHRMEDIEQALKRMEDGSYGKCTLCGKDIDIGRLEARPEADTCMDCSSRRRLSTDMIKKGRPVEEEVMNYPYNRKGITEEHDKTGFDGEDSLQAVFRYNRRDDDPSDQTGDHIGIWDDYLSGAIQQVEQLSNQGYRKQLPDDE